ncbi:hypothetical protein AMECASPLE_016942 [Ameca splendens]|uniref:Uncharacterized protein n=1 Tax=Ameca splendens TaxID=208324 RepID=A0ABV0XFH1_9TELE
MTQQHPPSPNPEQDPCLADDPNSFQCRFENQSFIPPPNSSTSYSDTKAPTTCLSLDPLPGLMNSEDCVNRLFQLYNPTNAPFPLPRFGPTQLYSARFASVSISVFFHSIPTILVPAPEQVQAGLSRDYM